MSGTIASRLLAIIGEAALMKGDIFTQQIQNEVSLDYTTTASVATGSGTAEQTLATFSLPANTLGASDRKVVCRASFSAAGNSHTKTFKLYAGASVISSGALTTNAKNGVAEIVLTRTGSKTQIAWGTMLVDTTPITPYVNTAATEDDTAAIVFKFTGTDGTDAAGDIVLNDFSVELQN